MNGDGHSLIDGDDGKYVSGLSTILVASIQEAKDRISQVEYIFCSQLYPNFQSKSKTLQKFYSEARKSLEDKWKARENDLLLQIEKMRLENQRLLRENELLKVEVAKVKVQFEQDLEDKQRRIEELERAIRKKGEEVYEGLEIQKNLVDLVQAKGSLVLEKEQQLKENEEKTKGLLDKVMKLEEEVEGLQVGIRRKDDQLTREVELREKLYANNVVELTSAIGNSEKERKRLLAQIDELEDTAAGIQKKFRIQTQQFEEGEELRKQLVQQIDLKSSELLENKKQFDECEKEKKLLLDKVMCLEEKINQLCKVRNATGESSSGMESHRKLLKQVESVTSDLQTEKKKRVQITEAYKRLKSQHNFLREKFGLTAENMLPKVKLENESNLDRSKSPVTAPVLEIEKTDNFTDACNTKKVKNEILEDDFGGLESKTPDTFVAVCETNKVNEEMLEDEKGSRLSPPSSSFHQVLKCPSSTKAASVSGTKRPASSWRQTRSRQSRGGPDLHDDFLDTPLENVRANINKASNKEDPPDPIQGDVSMESSDDETQDLNAKSSPQKKQSSITLASKKNFKYIEPVRKKAERENLKGVECKQCKKFYDAVLTNGDGKDPDSSKRSLRCEHHDGVSRHRYRYVPPMTPEGFWNIGFESEL